MRPLLEGKVCAQIVFGRLGEVEQKIGNRSYLRTNAGVPSIPIN